MHCSLMLQCMLYGTTYSNLIGSTADEVAVGRVGTSDTERRRHNIANESHVCQALSTELGYTYSGLIMASQLRAPIYWH